MKRIRNIDSFLNENVFKNFLCWMLESPSDEAFTEYIETMMIEFKQEHPTQYDAMVKGLQEQGILGDDGNVIKSGISRVFKGLKNM